jgi:two-component system LytT family sensor kinase
VIDSFEILIQLVEHAAVLLVIIFILTRVPQFREILQRENRSPLELTIIAIIFCLFAIFSTYSGINVEGFLVNVRIVTIISSGILFGPTVGITVGLISGIHRYLIDIGGIIAVSCLITSVIAGILSGIINKKVRKSLHWIYGILAGVFAEGLTILLILLMADSIEAGLDLVSYVALPMLIGQINIGLIVQLLLSVEGEKEQVASRQAQLSLAIANKTLPYFRKLNKESLTQVGKIIKDELKADAVGITNQEKMLAYVGYGEELYQNESVPNNARTMKAIQSGEITSIDTTENQALPGVQHLLIIPFKEKDVVTGALEIYFLKASKLTYPMQTMAIGLAQIFSTQMEVSRVEQLSEAANKAELQALQTKINPHFLFNALNTIASLTRQAPDKARKLIINLASYMRYSIEVDDELIGIHQALEQVKDYVEIESARFGDRLQVSYDIDPVDIKIPSLLIQPLVENAIEHGALKSRTKGTVSIAVKKLGSKIRISVKDSGPGIEASTISQLYHDKMPPEKIGLENVHQRVRLTYGTGLKFKELSPGTEVYFDIEEDSDESNHRGR